MFHVRATYSRLSEVLMFLWTFNKIRVSSQRRRERGAPATAAGRQPQLDDGAVLVHLFSCSSNLFLNLELSWGTE